MSNSPLICCTILSPNHSGKRTHIIDTITIHCMAGNLSVESCGALFAKSTRQASSNYGIGSDGRIALYVDEEKRSWCTSSRTNDQRAITIEVANNGGAPDWPVSDKAYEALILLVTDICERNDIKRLVWATDKESRVGHLNGCNMTVHRDYANKACPGNYLYNLHGEIAAEINKRLGIQVETDTTESTTSVVSEIKEGDLVKIADNAVYYSGKSIPAWVKAKNWYVVEVEGDRAIIDDSEDGKNAINSPVNTKYLTVVKAAENGSESVEKVELVKGAVVTFTGKKQYSSANGTTAVSCKPGKATITLDPYLKGKHPYHVVAVKGGTSNVYGWVDAEDIYEFDAQKTEEFTPYKVKVTVSALNIRKGAGTGYAVVGCIKDKGTYTIVAEENGWGKLKSGAGWISLAYTKRV